MQIKSYGPVAQSGQSDWLLTNRPGVRIPSGPFCLNDHKNGGGKMTIGISIAHAGGMHEIKLMEHEEKVVRKLYSGVKKEDALIKHIESQIHRVIIIERDLLRANLKGYDTKHLISELESALTQLANLENRLVEVEKGDEYFTEIVKKITKESKNTVDNIKKAIK